VLVTLTQLLSFVVGGRKLDDKALNGPKSMNGILLPRPRARAVKSAKVTPTKLTYRYPTVTCDISTYELKNERSQNVYMFGLPIPLVMLFKIENFGNQRFPKF